MYRKSSQRQKTIWSSLLSALMLTALLLPLCPVYAAEGEENSGDQTPVGNIWSGEVAYGFASGSGTRSDPYLIATAEELAYLAERVNSGDSYSGQYLRLTADLFLNELDEYRNWQKKPPQNEWTPIGGYSPLSVNDESLYQAALAEHGTLYIQTEHGYSAASQYVKNTVYYAFVGFSGHFDGDGYTIYGLYIDENASAVGLFGACKDATLVDLTLSSAYVSGNDEVAALIGHIDVNTAGLIDNCHVDANVRAAGNTAGGLIGSCVAQTLGAGGLSLEDCTFSGQLTAPHIAGGLIGSVSDSGIGGTLSIDDCQSSAYISADTTAGGIVGSLSLPSTLLNCVSEGALSSDQTAGGIVGEIASNSGYVTLSGCQNFASLVGRKRAGGIAGLCRALSEESAAEGEDTATLNTVIELLGCSNLGDLFGREAAGGIVGEACTFENTLLNLISCKNSAAITGQHKVGGIAGCLIAEGGSLSVGSSENHGGVSADTLVGGIVGEAVSSAELTIYQCFSYAAVTAANDYAGGIAGRIIANESGQLSLEQSCTNGNIKANKYAGGIVGAERSEGAKARAVISDCFSNALLTAKENAGGIAGCIDALQGQALTVNSLFVGSFSSGNKLTGGIAAYVYAEQKDALAQINQCHYLQSVSSRPALHYGGNGSELCQASNGLDDDALRDPEQLTGFDFTTIWQPSDEENLYPILRSTPFVWENFHYTTSGQSATLLSYRGRSDILIIPSKLGGVSVTTIADSAFRGGKMVKVILPDSVTTIGESAFADCRQLRSITLSSALRTVGTGAFKNCTSLETRRCISTLADLYIGSDNIPFQSLPITQPLTVQVDYLYENGVTAAKSGTITCYAGDYYLIDAPAVTGYVADLNTLVGICVNTEKIAAVYSIGSYQLTIRYLYPDGSQAAPDHISLHRFGEFYSISSPELSGYLPSNSVLEGLMEGHDLILTVYYSEQMPDSHTPSSTNQSLIIVLLVCTSFASVCCIGYFIFRYHSNIGEKEKSYDFEESFKPRF